MEPAIRAKLSGSNIPLGARIFSVTDCLDVMTSDRPYRKASSYEEARSGNRRVFRKAVRSGRGEVFPSRAAAGLDRHSKQHRPDLGARPARSEQSERLRPGHLGDRRVVPSPARLIILRNSARCRAGRLCVRPVVCALGFASIPATRASRRKSRSACCAFNRNSIF